MIKDDLLKGINTLMFCDESKFSKNDGNLEDAIYYFCVAADRTLVPKIHEEIKITLEKYQVQASTFHSSVLFKEKRPRTDMMFDLCNIIISNRLQTFCFRYPKAKLFEPTKVLSFLNKNGIFDFSNPEFQALFYFLMLLNTHLRDKVPSLLKKDIALYFDRNVYGKEDIEAFEFPSELFVIKRMTFSEKSLISLLALPDFLGYVFRKAKLSYDKAQSVKGDLEKSKLVINCYTNLFKIEQARLFKYLDFDYKSMGIALGFDLTSP